MQIDRIPWFTKYIKFKFSIIVKERKKELDILLWYFL